MIPNNVKERKIKNVTQIVIFFIVKLNIVQISILRENEVPSVKDIITQTSLFFLIHSVEITKLYSQTFLIKFP